MFYPTHIYCEAGALSYPQTSSILLQYKNVPVIEIEAHHCIPELRALPDSEYARMKHFLILGVRKSLTLQPNSNSADFIVPYTSSGCSALCLYCYLVCTFFKGAYLRVFVNRDAIIKQIIKTQQKRGMPTRYELGSNSDLIMENMVTKNLSWTIEQFSRIEGATCTFATKFHQIDDMLGLSHNKHTEMRISVNPVDIVRKVELGTSTLEERIDAANRLAEDDYPIGINVAPIILHGAWQDAYSDLFKTLKNKLSDKIQQTGFFELIFMTYGLPNYHMQQAALPAAPNLFNKEIMRPRGRGKYCYKLPLREEAATFFRKEIAAMFPHMSIRYIV